MRVKLIPNADPIKPGIYQVWCPACKREHPITQAWDFNGNMDKPTFMPSLLVHEIMTGPYILHPQCHSFIKDGKIKYLADCGHDQKGKTLDLPETEDWP